MFFVPLAIVALVLFSALLAASETALFSLARTDRARAALSGETERAVERILRRPLEFLIVLGTLSESANIFAECLAAAYLLARFGHTGAYLAVPLMFAIVLLFGEITPKTYALGHSGAIVTLTSRPLAALSALIAPLTRALLLPAQAVHAEAVSEAEFKTLLRLSEDQGLVESGERELIHRIFDFSHRRVSEVMTPRTAVFALSIDTPPDELLAQCTRGHFSRIPIYRGDPSNVVGLLYVKDLAMRRLEPNPPRLERLLRRPRFVPPSKRVGELFEEMRRDRLQMVLVVDEYGKLLGLVTLEDLLEELFGDIRDEFDLEVPEMAPSGSGEMLVSGSIRLDRLNQVLQSRGLKPIEGSEATLGERIARQLARSPRRGERLRLGELGAVVEKVRGGTAELVRLIP
jgi:putative hemolysin